MAGAWVLLLAVNARVVTLQEAVRTAEASQPRLAEVRAELDAALAQADHVRSPLLPQVKANGSYERTTGNRVWKRLGTPTASYRVPSSWDTFDTFDFGVTANQLVWDFGQTAGRLRAARAGADAVRDMARLTRLEVVLAAHGAFFAARAQKAMAEVARDTLANQERHLAQIAGFVEVGTRPAIDLAQARADLANARVRTLAAQNAYEIEKARLNQAMGVTAATDFDVADETFPEIDGEARPIEAFVNEALQAHPGLSALQSQIRAAELTVRALRGAYGPALSVGATVTEGGMELDALRWNAAGNVTLSWPLFQGLMTRADVREAEARVAALRAQAETLRQQVRFDVTEVALGLRAARESLSAAGEAQVNARERLRLADGRYETGIGSIIELGDAQLAATAAAAQLIRAEYELAASRARLLGALGRL